MNLTFYPGPSRLYSQVESYLAEACESGILSMNHRSGAFMNMLGHTITLLHEKLGIPSDYEIYFTSSATECWEIVAQSLTERRSLHAFNGAFGQKWFDYTRRIFYECMALPFGMNDTFDAAHLKQAPIGDVLCLTHNETSNATALSSESLEALREAFDGIIAVDATSSMAGVALPWTAADVWFASVQKCFGLPPGLGVMLVSPRAIRKAEQKNDRNYYNSLLFIRDNFLKNQTPYTPNTLAIYLLGRVMEQVPPIREVDLLIRNRASDWYRWLENKGVQLLVENAEVRSPTVIALEGAESFVQNLKNAAYAEGIILGSGYGTWKSTSLRIANFPAIPDSELAILRNFLQNNISKIH